MNAHRPVGAVLLSLCGGMACIGVPNFALGQRFGTVQLPTFQRFSMTTSLWVPDQGNAYAGGMRNSGMSHRRGARSGRTSSSGVTVTAYIHDFDALDTAVLEKGRQARLRNGKSLQTFEEKSDPTAIRRRVTISEVRAQTESKRVSRYARARSEFDLAQRLLANGKLAASRIMLKSALSRADDALRARITKQLAALEPLPRTDHLAQNDR